MILLDSCERRGVDEEWSDFLRLTLAGSASQFVTSQSSTRAGARNASDRTPFIKLVLFVVDIFNLRPQDMMIGVSKKVDPLIQLSQRQ